MIRYLRNPKDAARKLLELISESGKVAEYKINAQGKKINAQGSLAFLYTNNRGAEREIKETISSTSATKK